MPQKIFIIACEISGDLHGSHLVSELKKISPAAEFRGLGGPQMKAEGVNLLYDMTTISALGLGDVLRQYFKYREIFYNALREAQSWRPDAVIMIDSPAFNLRFAKKIHKALPRLPLIYYISPQIWAWGGRRIHLIRKTISKMLCILPFEIPMYQKANVDCEFVGHPLLDRIDIPENRGELRKKLGIIDPQIAVGLLPGSRKKEILRILPIMVDAAAQLEKIKPGIKYFLAKSPNLDLALYQKILGDNPLKIQILEKDFYEAITAFDFALVTSGTATLETALLGTPFFLLYKASWSTYWLGKHLIKVPYLGIVNLLAHKRVVPEFIQNDAHPETIAHEAKILLENPPLYQEMKEEFKNVRKILGNKGASRRAAQAVLNFLKKN